MNAKARGAFIASVAALIAIAPPATAPAVAATPHLVQPGETLWSIAAANNFTTRTVAAFNGLSETATIVAGQTIQVPTLEEGAAALAAAGVDTSTTATPTAAAAAGHMVAAGESLSSIAAANGVTIDALASANGRAADSFVYIGETLSIPAATAATATTSSTAGLGHIPSPYGELHLAPDAAEDWNAMRTESLNSYGVDLYPAGSQSAHRTYEQQAQMYEDYLNGVGPLAAPPGTSAHETGHAVDLATEPMRTVIDEIGWAYGWGKTEAWGEWWHINHSP